MRVLSPQAPDAVPHDAGHGRRWRDRRSGSGVGVYPRSDESPVEEREHRPDGRTSPDATTRTVRRPSAGSVGDRPPGFVRLPRMWERRSRSRRSPGGPVVRPRDASRPVAREAGRKSGLFLRIGPWVNGMRRPAREFGFILGYATGDVQAAQRSRTIGPAAEGISPHPSPIREARHHPPRLHHVRFHI